MFGAFSFWGGGFVLEGANYPYNQGIDAALAAPKPVPLVCFRSEA